MRNEDQLVKASLEAMQKSGGREEALELARKVLLHYPDTDAARKAQEIVETLASTELDEESSETKAVDDGIANSKAEWDGKNTSTDRTTSSGTYGAGRGIAGLAEFLGWTTVIGGCIAIVYALSQSLGTDGVLIGIALIIGGLFQIMGAQIVKATIDNAVNTRSILNLLQKEH